MRSMTAAPTLALVLAIAGLAWAQDTPYAKPAAKARATPATATNAAPRPAQPGSAKPASAQPAKAPAVKAPGAAAAAPRAAKSATVPADHAGAHHAARSARTAARIAGAEARCLQEAARHVDRAAQDLANTIDPTRMGERRDKLAFALGVIDECRTIAQKRSDAAYLPAADAPDDAPPMVDEWGAVQARAAEASKAKPSMFSFGRIAIDPGSAAAPVDGAAVAHPLRRHAARFRGCYDQAVSATPQLKGTVKIRMRLAARGDDARASSVAIPAATLRDPAVHRCLAQALMSTPFPQSASGSNVSLDMTFSR
jgi:hypothetical protein